MAGLIVETIMEKFICGTCSKVYSHKTSLERHISTTHSASAPLRCPAYNQGCRYSTYRRDDLRRHQNLCKKMPPAAKPSRAPGDDDSDTLELSPRGKLNLSTDSLITTTSSSHSDLRYLPRNRTSSPIPVKKRKLELESYTTSSSSSTHGHKRPKKTDDTKRIKKSSPSSIPAPAAQPSPYRRSRARGASREKKSPNQPTPTVPALMSLQPTPSLLPNQKHGPSSIPYPRISRDNMDTQTPSGFHADANIRCELTPSLAPTQVYIHNHGIRHTATQTDLSALCTDLKLVNIAELLKVLHLPTFVVQQKEKTL